MNIPDNLFDLTEEEITTSKMMYSDKVIKCLVAPYHTYAQLENEIVCTPTTFLFPEKEMSAGQIRSFISMVVKSNRFVGEIRIVTANQSVIMDMVGVKILTERGDIVDCDQKTFMANIHDIRYNVLDNSAHQLNDNERENGKELVNSIIEEINGNTTMSSIDYNNLVTRIGLIGEPVISTELMRMVGEIQVV